MAGCGWAAYLMDRLDEKYALLGQLAPLPMKPSDYIRRNCWFEAEPEEADIMARPPRKPDAPLFDTALMLHGLLQGGVVMIAALGVFKLGIGDLHGEQVARCMAFVTLVLGNLGLVLTNRSLKTSAFVALTRPNRALGIVVVVTLTALALALWVPWLRGLFGFAPLAWPRLGEAAAAALGCIVVNDLIGVVWRSCPARRSPPPARA